MEEQLSLFDIEPQQMDSVCCGSLHIVKASILRLPVRVCPSISMILSRYSTISILRRLLREMAGAINVKRINESMKHATNALFSEYACCMFARLAYKESGDETGCCKRGLWN